MVSTKPKFVMRVDGEGCLAIFTATSHLVALVGDPLVIVGRAFVTGWSVHQRHDGLAVAIQPNMDVEQLPLDPGHYGWRRLPTAEVSEWLAA